MRIAVFSARAYDRRFLDEANERHGHELHYLEARLDANTAALADGYEGVCVFVNDTVDAATMEQLAAGGTRLLTLRSAGYNHVDLAAAEAHDIAVARVPAYSPYAVAEHTVALMLAVQRKIHRAHNRVRDGNFALDGLLGFDLRNKRIGIIGTGKIGMIVARIMRGFGCSIRAYDPYPNDDVRDFGVRYEDLDTLLGECDVITLHCPLTPDTHHIIDEAALRKTKPGVMIVNTSRGALIDTKAVIDALKDGRIGHLALDVYEEEGDLFFEDLSDTVIRDDVFSRLLTFPNVLITAHQAFFTEEALRNIAESTLGNASAFAEGRASGNEVRIQAVRG
ncbi:2-hydroxyacid dehydrogenase [Egicoccus halophilus]|uniref:Lactate dehydrogenase n=1 Tax=Egicoccus halophilus TaxID=1670830 RepID=A0A8J3A8U5_9ACTN|nr:2-hydroxyacid dehydrogenase [Egicoccus halophilus]GGI04487.1 lactate dehydrogenase [Egicoccus halophilus]